MANKWVNSFTAGLHSDFDPSAQPPNTYRESINGRVFFNEATGSLSWTNVLGNTRVFEMKGDYGTKSGYVPLGTVEFTDYIAILSFNQTNSEIGFATFSLPNNTWTYNTAYNDKYDPNNQLLNFKMYADVQSIRANVENNEIQRIYWTNGVDMDKVFNMKEGLQSVNPAFVNGDYRPLVATGKYPPFYSSFSMDSSPDFQQGIVKFVQNVNGEKLSGVYQYCYRLVTKDGYKTPFTWPTKHIFLTSDAVNTNSQTYAMQPSEVATSKGIQLQVTGIDTRYFQMEVCYIYSVAPSQSMNAAVFATVDIDGQSSITVNDISNRGTPVALDALFVRGVTPLTVKDLAVKEKRMFKGGITVQQPVKYDASQVTVKPYIKSMVGDQNTLTEQDNPFVNTGIYTTQSAIRKYTDVSSIDRFELYSIIGDYINYKGTQVEHLYPSYFREEWYRVGVLFFDTKGYPMFVNFLFDIQFPAQGTNTYFTIQLDTNGNPVKTQHTFGAIDDYALTDNGADTGNRVDFANPASVIRMRIMGMMVSNLDLTDVINNNEIGGFSIVRAERDPTILAQGLLLNTVIENQYGHTTSLDYNTTRPMGFPSNHFDSGFNWLGLHGGDVNIDGRDGNANKACTYTFTYECPDYILDPTVIPALQNNHVLRSVAGCWMDGLSGDNGDFGLTDFGSDDPISGGNGRLGLINKTYFTSAKNFLDLDGRPITFGYSNGISFYLPFGQGTVIKGYDPSTPLLEFDGVTELNTQFTNLTPLANDKSYQGVYHDEGLLIKSASIGANLGLMESSVVRSGSQFVTYRIVNYVIDGKVPYGGVNADSLAQTIYIPTGHFQPINATVKAQVLTGGGRYIFNNVEVWGGDCYPNLYGLARVYASGDHSRGGVAGVLHNIAIGNVFPCEMKYNASLRKGNTWQRSGFLADSPYYPLGVSAANPEENLINNVLTYDETNALAEGFPINQNFQTDFGNRYIYSPPKIDADPVDAWRLYPVNQFDDMEGLYGKIVGSFELFSYVYCLQERSLGRLRILDRTMLPNETTDSLILGFGGILDSIEYLNQEFGTQHELSICTTGRSAYWVDAKRRAICRFSANGFECISDQHGLHNELNTLFTTGNIDFSFDNPSLQGGILSYYDRENREINFVFINNPVGGNPKVRTLCFSEENDAFSQHSDLIPTKVARLGDYLLTYNAILGNFDDWFYLSNVGAKGSFYGFVFNSVLQYAVNAKIIRNLQETDHGTSKVFGNLEINGNNSTTIITRFDFQTELTTDSITMPDNRVRYREGKIWLPARGQTTAYRGRGLYMLTKITISNATNVLALIRSVVSSWRVSHK